MHGHDFPFLYFFVWAAFNYSFVFKNQELIISKQDGSVYTVRLWSIIQDSSPHHSCPNWHWGRTENALIPNNWSFIIHAQIRHQVCICKQFRIWWPYLPINRYIFDRFKEYHDRSSDSELRRQREIKFGTSSRWSSSLYCTMRNSGGMTIGKTHPT